MDAAREDAIEQSVAAKEAAEEQLAEERSLRDRLMQAAAAGQLPRQAPDADNSVEGTPGVPTVVKLSALSQLALRHHAPTLENP